jgi:predicted nucleic acid-binding protein
LIYPRARSRTPGGRTRHLKALGRDDEVTRFELLAGVRTSELEALEAFFSSLAWAPINEQVSRTAGTLAHRLRHSHGGIDDADYLIAATAIVLEAPGPSGFRRRVA